MSNIATRVRKYDFARALRGENCVYSLAFDSPPNPHGRTWENALRRVTASARMYAIRHGIRLSVTTEYLEDRDLVYAIIQVIDGEPGCELNQG